MTFSELSRENVGEYNHVIFAGKFFFTITIVISIVISIGVLTKGGTWLIAIIYGLTISLLYCMSILRISVKQRILKVSFAFGLFPTRVNLSDIRESRAIGSQLMYGLGFRLMPRARIYVLAGCDSVELVLKNNLTISISTDQVEELQTRIQDSIKS